MRLQVNVTMLASFSFSLTQLFFTTAITSSLSPGWSGPPYSSSAPVLWWTWPVNGNFLLWSGWQIPDHLPGPRSTYGSKGFSNTRSLVHRYPLTTLVPDVIYVLRGQGIVKVGEISIHSGHYCQNWFLINKLGNTLKILSVPPTASRFLFLTHDV